jgi:mono/diheme cytochrome c family protein
MARKNWLILLTVSTLWASTGSMAQDQKAATSSADKAPATAAGSSSSTPYTVKDGIKVDDRTFNGWKTWRALACERCHGAEQEGLVGPSLIERLKILSKDDFHKLMQTGRPEKGMPNFNGSKMVQDNWEGLYAYLKGRSDGAIKPGHLQPLDK